MTKEKKYGFFLVFEEDKGWVIITDAEGNRLGFYMPIEEFVEEIKNLINQIVDFEIAKEKFSYYKGEKSLLRLRKNTDGSVSFIITAKGKSTIFTFQDESFGKILTMMFGFRQDTDQTELKFEDISMNIEDRDFFHMYS